MNKIISLAAKKSFIKKGKPKSNTLRTVSYIEDKQRYIYFTTRYVFRKDNKKDEYTADDYITVEKNGCTWIYDKTGQKNLRRSPSVIAREYSKYYKPFNVYEHFPKSIFPKVADKYVKSAKPIIGYNPKFDKTEHQVYCYDLNSAYAMVLMDKIPDTHKMRIGYQVVKENEIGFLNTPDLNMVHSGGYADFVFPLIDSPLKSLIKKYYDIKKNSPKGSKENIQAKDTLVVGVGTWQNNNPFLRAYVVNTCNEHIRKIIQAHKDIVCCWNTDAVYAVEPINDLNLGNEIGQFKLEYQGLFRQVGNNYQKVETNEVCYRGVLKSSFKEGYNILTDEIPISHFQFVLNQKTMQLEFNEEYEVEEYE